MVAFPSSGSELIRVATSLLILGIALILLNGLITLKVLNDFKLTLDDTKSRTPVMTMIKSMKFQPSLRYDNL